MSPLDDSGLDVRWMAPVDWSTSGFVVEWFAAREMNSSILHWERLNSSCTALVITGNPSIQTSLMCKISCSFCLYTAEMNEYEVIFFYSSSRSTSHSYLDTDKYFHLCVVSEGLKPLERYVVSVKVLYGDRGVGQNRTVHIYTRQGGTRS